MSFLLRASSRSRISIIRAVNPSIRTYTASTSLFAEKSDSKTQPLGAIGKGDPKARPVILEHAAPTDSDDPDVKKHNEEFANRAERAASIEGDDNGSGAKKENETGKAQGRT